MAFEEKKELNSSLGGQGGKCMCFTIIWKPVFDKENFAFYEKWLHFCNVLLINEKHKEFWTLLAIPTRGVHGKIF